MAIDANRLKELDNMVRRMGALASIFGVRSDSIGNSHFGAFRDLMDLYTDMCGRQLKEGNDFLDDGVKPTEDDVARVNLVFERIFGFTPENFKAK
ncbi:MAG: hypothetical protein NXI19_06535 [Alphaproteobacteria bacterium]|nr:hypothetical protein [Alphaproteobacteria bacterium]